MRRSTNWDYPAAKILVIDDNEANLEIVRELLIVAGYCYVQTLTDSGLAVETILKEDPDLVLLDLHMPKITGYDVLAQLNLRINIDAFLPVLVFTADSTPAARKSALDLGANDFITKPVDNVELMLRVRNFLRMRHMHLAMSDENLELESRVRSRTEEIAAARAEGLQCLARALEYRDDVTGGHTKRVGAVSGEIARALGLSDWMVELIQLAAPLHDIGKIGISDSLLQKNSHFTPEEFEIVKKHTSLGATIVSECASPVLQLVREIALHHHERWDGTGYPSGLRGSEIPISCRIVAVADVYDALISDRPYKRAWSKEDAMEEIRRQKGSQFDPDVVDAFLGCYL